MILNRKNLRDQFLFLDNQFKSSVWAGFLCEIAWVPVEQWPYYLVRDSADAVFQQLTDIRSFSGVSKLVLPYNETLAAGLPQNYFYRVVQNGNRGLNNPTEVLFTYFIESDDMTALKNLLISLKDVWDNSTIERFCFYFDAKVSGREFYFDRLGAAICLVLEVVDRENIYFLNEVYDQSPYLDRTIVFDFISARFAEDSSYRYHCKFYGATLPQIPVCAAEEIWSWSVQPQIGIQILDSNGRLACL